MCCKLYSQVTPKDSSTINYTQVKFEFPKVDNAENYLIQLAESPNLNTYKEFKCLTNLKIVTGLKFGKYYKWRVLSFDRKEKLIDSTSYFLFAIKGVGLVNKELFNFRLVKYDSINSYEGITFIDYNRTAIDRRGEPVWYLPDIKNKVNNTERIRDLRMTYDGNFTFLNNRSAIECDINGTVLWEAPIKNTEEYFYHHCFEKLSTGNYMVLGSEVHYIEMKDSVAVVKFSNSLNKKMIEGKTFIKVEFGTVLEYNPKGDLVWSWNSRDYLKDEELFAHGNADTMANPGAHMNSFDVNEKTGLISVGFRDLSQVYIIDKKSKTVIETYGKNLFKYQHDSRFLADEKIAVFNNNNIYENLNSQSSVVIFDRKNKEIINWEFKCNFDSLSDGRSLKGGSVSELPNGNLLIAMGHLNRIFEVTKSKKIVWDGFYEQYSLSEKKWKTYPHYRVSSSSSLYPNCFSLKLSESKKKLKELMILNNGSESDSYSVLIKNSEGSNVKSVITERIEAGKDIIIPIKNKEYSIEVSSMTSKKKVLVN